MHGQRIVVVSASGAGMLATFLPWASALGLMSVAGTQGDGWFSLGFFAIAMAAALTGDRTCAMSTGRRFIIEMVALMAAILGIDKISTFYYASPVTIGPGLYLVVGAALVLVGTAWWGESWLPRVFAFVVAIIVGAAGFVHVPYGEQLHEPAICWKRGWSLDDTFPDVDKLVGKEVTEFNAKVMNALFDCGVLKEVVDSKPAPVKTYGYCTFDGREGTCMSVEQCTGIHRPGFCMGPDNIQCCVQ